MTGVTDGALWKLDGHIFKQIVIESRKQRRSTELGFLDNVDLFKKLDKYEKLRLLDGIKVQWFNKTEAIVRAGERGEMFYIIEEGHVDCLQVVQQANGMKKERLVRKLTSGDHFGELALISPDAPRTLTIRCGSERAKLLAIGRQAFNRILGQID